MKVLVVDNTHLIRDKEGRYYSESVYSYEFLERYLAVFDAVRFIGKTKFVDTAGANCKRVDGPGVEIVPLPWYQGMGQMLKVFPRLIGIYRHLLDDCDCCILRIAQIESFLTYIFAKRRGKPFAVEVVNDPATFTDMPNLYRLLSIYMVKKMCKKATAASYVTKDFLQKKYPTGAKYTTNYSSIELHKENIKCLVEPYSGNGPLRIVHVANSINTDIKGHYCLINAAKRVRDAGYDVKVDFIGDGNKVLEYKEYIEHNMLQNDIRFIGRINGRTELLQVLKEYHLMVLPTKMEGLPRTIIEAMAVGMPCISTPIAGVPELLPGECLITPDDDKAFAEKIIDCINNPETMKKMGEENIEKAKEYTNDILSARRSEMYRFLKSEIIKRKSDSN